MRLVGVIDEKNTPYCGNHFIEKNV